MFAREFFHLIGHRSRARLVTGSTHVIGRRPLIDRKSTDSSFAFVVHKILSTGTAVIVGFSSLLVPNAVRAGSTPAPVTANALSAPENLVELRLDALKHVVRKGERILVRVTALNRSSEIIGVMQLVPWEVVDLHVLSDGHAIIPSRIGSGIRNRGAISAVLRPGQSWIFQTYVDPGSYYPIEAWGYWQVPPGRYTIFATPHFGITIRSARRSAQIKSWSNGVIVTVEP